MSAIKKFFQKKKMDIKFKKAGGGHKLTDDTREGGNTSGASYESKRPNQAPTDAQLRAREAALARTTQPRPGTSSSSIKAAARREVEEEMKRKQATNTTQQNEVQVLDTAPVCHATNLIYFKCPLVTDEVLSKEEMEIRIHEFLLGQLAEEAEMASALMIYTLNKDKEKVQTCIDTICKYLDNIILNPDEEKFRKIRVGNKVYKEKVDTLNGAEEFLQSAGFSRKTLPFQDGEESFLCMGEEMCKDKDRLNNLKEILHTAEPIRPELDRGIKVYHSSNKVTQFGVVPEEFYNISPEELKREQQIRSDAVEKLGMLRTKAMRERDEQRELRRYRYTIIRVRFPEGIILQGLFRPMEKLSALFTYVRENLADNWMPFFLHTSTGNKLSEDSNNTTLAEQGLAPTAVVNFSWEPSILEEVLAQHGTTQMPPALCKSSLSKIQSL